ncbi:MAG TPA: FkbM family methyltransferase [Tabrizicola sp.]|nr:FkbM family methyltransferase [Tabrizicola sp.]
MIRALGPYMPRRAHKLNAPITAMLLNGLHDHHSGRVFAVQIGAGTGESGFSLLQSFREDGWSGLLIEPHPGNFAQLDTLHAESDRVAVLNLGVSDVAANLPLYSLTADAEARMRRGPRGRASLVRDRIATSGLSTEDLTSTEVPFLRMDTVLQELGIDTAHLVSVNAGGHEAQVLQSFDLSSLDPSLVLVHSTAGTSSDDACIASLTVAGLLPFRVNDWLLGLAPGRLAVPLEELLTFFRKGLGAVPEDDE